MSGTLEDDYALLGLRVGANDDEAKLAYKRLSRQVHPDAGGTDALFTALRLAYERILGDGGGRPDEPSWTDASDEEPESPIWEQGDSPRAPRGRSGGGVRPRSTKSALALVGVGLFVAHQLMGSSLPEALTASSGIGIVILSVVLATGIRGPQRGS